MPDKNKKVPPPIWGEKHTRSPYRNFKFRVERFDGGWKEFAGFQKVSGMSVEMETETYEEGGVNGHTHELPKQMSYTNLTLERGLTDQEALVDWMEEVKMAVQAQGEQFRKSPQNTPLHPSSGWKSVTKETPPPSGPKSNLRVLVDDGEGKPGWGWTFTGAVPVKWEGPDLDASSTNLATQTLEISYDTFSKGASKESKR